MEKTQKKKIRRGIAWGCLAVLVLLLAVLPLAAAGDAAEDGPKASILTATAEQRDITRQLIGGGLLTSQETLDLTIPAEVKLTGYLVGNGDVVSEGDAIAEVDRVSVLNAIVQVQETLEYLSGKLESTRQDVVSRTVAANVGGTVKYIYGTAGEDVADVMLEHGALAVISLDGLMAVKVSCRTDLVSGDPAAVTLADGTGAVGTVASNINGELVVTFADKGYAEGTRADVATEAGEIIGTGELYLYSAWRAHGYSGLIDHVMVQEGQPVYAGQTLMQLTETGATAEYLEYLSQRRDYEDMMAQLFRMYDSGVLEAPCDGIVSGVDPEGDFLLVESGSLKSVLAAVITASGSNDRAQILLPTDSGSGTSEGSPEQPGTNPETPPEEPPAGGEEGGGEQPGEGGGEDPDTPAVTYSGYAAMVLEVGADGSVTVLRSPNPYPITNKDHPEISVDQSSLTEVYTYPSLPGAVSAGQVIWIITDSEGAVSVVTMGQSGGQMPGAVGGGMPGMGSMGGSGEPAAKFEPYTLETLTVATVTSQGAMTLEITVDEADVRLLHVGQDGDLLVSALEGQHFDAVITRISNDGVNEGGRSKFTVTAAVEKHTDMYPGMTASLLVAVDHVSQTTALPVAALVEDGTKTTVYTGYDEEKGAFTGPVTVTTGISDGEYVQISGLEPGTQVWYAYYDTVTQSLTPEIGGFRR